MKKKLKKMSYDDGIRFFKVINYAFAIFFYYAFGFEMTAILLLSNISVYLFALEKYARPKGVAKDESQRTDDERVSEKR
ncbi:hypothetical protein [Enterococcus casseliflavus]|uniref:hypothetical protein n=1 Tax=Enterococcus casseliflavus TaxID=37734 RepID=UPI00032E2A3D|nr:hypothetical protein [Enterococcus casseliflavus]EOH85477.1 hypothetical protein UAM_00085 [Enterococcus casseliflavus ATCC 49996]EOU10161.1 hypothetical protein I582_00672 [Enterococcus casseliflavus ATCC 49996]QQB84080.1 hypothetical protein I6H55_09015 [Enterococcus casseliflavus]